jgi:hypothetical protein
MGRISALTELTSLASNDYLLVLDSSANIAKKISVANAFGIPDLGFTASGETWVYASATTITVPSDATTKYAEGMVIKITQSTGGTKYAVIDTVASTLLTITMLNGATLANETISSPFYTTVATPLGVGKLGPTRRTGGFKIGVISAATLGTTGNKAITGVGFKPKLVRFTMLQTTGTVNVIYGNGSMTSASQYTASSCADASGRSRYSSTSNCISGVGATTSTPFILANYVSMNSDGFTINVSTASNAFDWAYEAYA